MGIASLVLGILSIAFCWSSWVGALLGLIGLILGAIGTKKHKKCSVAGLILSIIGFVLGAILFIACAAAVTGAAMYY